eukprot:CAMPEP_0194060574 /NCGR_PEP_ID=MMETSP0009_2-20130614/72147_1 /TAXON_ID=210454 /ORGANISM="Grammatophora oceanica, Strain CCMP 410" /LENGTH=281 /DNA_ID=CAMNT_0038711529 /DNA_START=36 /DNA_END=881 /DNA_ORIENTATION=-
MKHPTALLGLSLTSRASPRGKSLEYQRLSRECSTKQSFGYLLEYTGATSSCNVGSVLLQDVMSRERSIASKSDVSEEELIVSVQDTSVLLSSSASFQESKKGDLPQRVDLRPSAAPETQSSLDQGVGSLSRARQLIHDPEDATALLKLAKLQAQQLSSVQHIKKRKLIRQMVDSALLAANRAASVFDQYVRVPRKVVGPKKTTSNGGGGHVGPTVRSRVDASQVAQSIALSYWVGKASQQLLTDEESTDNAQTQEASSVFDLQRALIMCPDNRLVRNALSV